MCSLEHDKSAYSSILTHVSHIEHTCIGPDTHAHTHTYTHASCAIGSFSSVLLTEAEAPLIYNIHEKPNREQLWSPEYLYVSILLELMNGADCTAGRLHPQNAELLLAPFFFAKPLLSD